MYFIGIKIYYINFVNKYKIVSTALKKIRLVYN